MYIFNKIVDAVNFWKTEETYQLFTPEESKSVFTLKYKNLEVGKLSVKNGEWTFAYSEEFKNQSRLQPLVDFPSKDKTYSSKGLWPFFSSRIPSVKTPTVRETARNKNININNEVEMLKEFGGRTITNPFLLVAQ